MKKFLALLLAGIMLFALIACNKTPATNDNGGGTQGGETGDLNEDPEYANPNLPAQNFGRDIVFLSREDFAFREVGMEEDDSEAVASQVYKRDRYLENKYNVDLKLLDRPNSEVASYAMDGIETNTLNFDVIVAGFASTFWILERNDLLNISEVPHLNLDKAYWNKAIMENTSIADQVYMIMSPMNLQTLHAASCVFFNTGLYDDLMDTGVYDKSLYDIVRDKEWTFDKMAEISRKAYFDNNGNNIADVGDRFGSVSTLASCEGMLSGMGGMYVVKNEEDIPEYKPVNEAMSDRIAKIINFWADDTSLLVNRYTNSDEIFNTSITNKNLLFVQEQMYQYGAFNRYGDYPVGILPMPMFDEQQEDYYTFSHINWSSVTSIPKVLSTESVEEVGYILEDMAYLSQRDVFPVYYEVNLKARRAEGDPNSAEMLDIMFKTLNVDLGNVLANASFDAVYVLRDLVQNKGTDIVSKFEVKAPVYTAYVNKLVKGVQGNK